MVQVVCLVCTGEKEPFGWELVKRLRGNNRLRAIAYLAGNQSEAPCVFCPTPIPNVLSGKTCDVDHIDGNEKHNHRFNLRLAHHGCNSTNYQEEASQRAHAALRERIVPKTTASTETPVPVLEKSQPALTREEGERENLVRVGVGSEVEAPWSNREGEESVKMNAAIDDWLSKGEDGPFAVHREGRVVLVPVEIKMLALMGATMLKQHPKIGHASQTTVQRYLERRSVGSTLSEPGELSITIDTQTGIKYVTYRGKNKLIEKLTEQTAAKPEPASTTTPTTTPVSPPTTSKEQLLADRFKGISERHTTQTEEQGVS